MEHRKYKKYLMIDKKGINMKEKNKRILLIGISQKSKSESLTNMRRSSHSVVMKEVESK